MSITSPDQTDGPTAPTSDLEIRDIPTTAPATQAAPQPATTTGVGPSWPRRHRLGLALAAVAVAGAAAFAVTAAQSDTAADTSATAAPISAVEAISGDLMEFLTVDGTLAFEDPVPFTASVDGTITEIADVDDVLQRGDTAYAVDASPVVVLWGDFPIYRPLSAGVEDGADIAVLEANLAALGYTADGSLVIDDSFDSATTAAIEAFQTDVGLPVDGAIDPASVLVLPGPAIVADTDLTVGSVVRAGGPILSLQVTDTTTTVGLAASDTDATEDTLVTELPTVGETLDTGDVAYEIDTEPVIVIIGDTALDRDLSIESSDGPDIELLEQTLLSLGYDAGGDLELDEHFDDATTEALTAWEEDLELDGDGVASLNEFVVLPAGHRVTDIEAERGDSLGPGNTVFTVGISTRSLTATVDEADSDLITIGATVEVDIGDQTVPGTIVDSSDTPADPSDPAATDTVTIEIQLDETVDVGDNPSVDVEVRIVESLAENVVLVPASALISVGDGSYAVEVVRGETTAFVAVEPGMFADGVVEVDGIDAGTAVVVPT